MKQQEIDRLCHGGFFGSLDEHFAALMERLGGGDSSPELFLAAALASRSTGQGNICLDLKTLAGRPLVNEEGRAVLVCPQLDSWRRSLEESPVVGSPGEFRPLILDKSSRLYFHRYWEYEQAVAGRINELACRRPGPVDAGLFAESLERLFPLEEPDSRDRQRIAAACALVKKLTVISGGPGTGKTTIVAKILALLLEQPGGADLRIALCAPTGKAAARLQEAVGQAKETLDCSDEVRRAVPDDAGTIHRLLGFRLGSASCRHGPDNPLPYDIVVVDESSMVDLALMARLLGALLPSAGLILLGDRDQLASVEAGSVLGDICAEAEVPGFSQDFAAGLGGAAALELTLLQRADRPVAACVVQLDKSYRFGSSGGIGRLCGLVNSGDSRRALELLGSPDYPDVAFSGLPRPDELAGQLKTRVIEGFRDYLRVSGSRKALDLLGKFRILCAVRKGPYGVEALNSLVGKILSEEGLLQLQERWYSGRPLMINRNDYELGLYNGDVGLIQPDETGRLRAVFTAADGSLKSFLPSRLPEHETVFAMTIHKSQGSEFDDALIILPERESPLLTRELVYTAVTRARRSVEILGKESVFTAAVSSRIARTSGLREALWGVSDG